LHSFTGAFAAGILLANTNYRAQIQADILPFKGILLGIFFMEAGSQFDTELVLAQWPTIFVASAGLIVLKGLVVALATADRSPIGSRMPLPDAIRLSLLLAGGGEFAFVVLALAEKLGVIPRDLASVVTAIILITMGLTPILGDLAASLSEKYVDVVDDGESVQATEEQLAAVAPNSIVVCGYGEIGRSVLKELGSGRALLLQRSTTMRKIGIPYPLPYPRAVAFDTYPAVFKEVGSGNETTVLYGDGANAHVIRSSGIENPSAIFVTYEEHNRALSATARLRAAFANVPIYTRAATRAEIPFLLTAGATEVVVESDELPRAAPQLFSGVWGGNLEDKDHEGQDLRAAAASAAGVSVSEVDDLLELFAGMDMKVSGGVGKYARGINEKCVGFRATEHNKF
jgi:voltage-gated potassium channel Kch